MEKSEVIQKKVICTLRWSENIKFYIFTSENIKYTLYFINIFLYFMTLYIIKEILCQKFSTFLFYSAKINTRYKRRNLIILKHILIIFQKDFAYNRKITDIVFSQIHVSKKGLTFKIRRVVSEYQIQTNV